MNSRRVAVTGIGIVSPIGCDAESTWTSLMEQRSGVAPISQFDASCFPAKIAAEVKPYQASKSVNAKLRKFSVNFTNFALDAAQQAIDDCGIKPNKSDANRWGVVTGSGMMTSEFEYLQRLQQQFATSGEIDWQQVNREKDDFFQVSDFGKTIANSGLALLINAFGIRGYANAVHTACASGGQALGLGLQAIRRGEVDTLLAGGFDSMINPLGVSSFCLLGALSTYNDTPHTASRPFDYNRNGFVLGEGASFLVLEEWHKAKKRGAKIYAELAGEGNSLSSYRITDSHPSGDGAIQAIKGALNDAAIGIDDVDYINAHGTSTKMNDLSETNAIKAVFGNRAHDIAVSSTKSLTGHLIAAAGALEAAISILSIVHGKIPMTTNLTHPDPECDLDYVTDMPRDKNIKAVLSNSFGFGGSNSCLLFKHPEYEGKCHE
jgi:beta-ketoacyl-acyl-carrier-protein synthase II